MKTKLFLSSLTLIAAASLQTGCAIASQAYYPVTPPAVHPPLPRYVPAERTRTVSTVGNTVGLMVRDSASQSTLPIYYAQGEYWVAGMPGQGYELMLTSRIHGRRALATTSVDGINVVSGETAGYVQRGYVLSPRSTAVVAGWRKSEHEIARFNFAAPQASYAAQTGRPANVGVIGVAVFPELIVPPPPPVVYSPPVSDTGYARGGAAPAAEANKPAATKRSDGTVADSSTARTMQAMPAAPAPGLGTQHGQRESSYAPTVAFQRESQTPSELISLRYDTVENLVARGVLRWTQAYQPLPVQPPRPAPFPQSGFVPDPPRVR